MKSKKFNEKINLLWPVRAIKKKGINYNEGLFEDIKLEEILNLMAFEKNIRVV